MRLRVHIRTLTRNQRKKRVPGQALLQIRYQANGALPPAQGRFPLLRFQRTVAKETTSIDDKDGVSRPNIVPEHHRMLILRLPRPPLRDRNPPPTIPTRSHIPHSSIRHLSTHSAAAPIRVPQMTETQTRMMRAMRTTMPLARTSLLLLSGS